MLLKNANSFLPLDPNKVKKVAVIGPLGDVCHLGDYSGHPATRITPFKGIATRLGAVVTQEFYTGGEASIFNGSVRLQELPNGTQQLAYISDGDWAKYDKIDFTGKTTLRAKVASGASGGTIAVHLDSLAGPLAGTLTVTNTGGWEKLVDVDVPLTGITGVHDVFLVFHGTDQYVFNVEQIVLEPVVEVTTWVGNGPQVLFHGGCSVTGDKVDPSFQDAVDIAKGADAVVLVCGVDISVSHEEYDRTDIKLTGA